MVSRLFYLFVLINTHILLLLHCIRDVLADEEMQQHPYKSRTLTCGLVRSKAKAIVGAYINKNLVGELIYSKPFIFVAC